LIDVKRKFINSDNHKFHQYQENDYLVFNTTFTNISVTTFVAEIGVIRENHRPVASH
jgi:hypothetical protein